MLRRTAENNNNWIPNNTDWRLINKPPPRTNPTNVHANPDPNNKPPPWGQCRSIRYNSRSIWDQCRSIRCNLSSNLMSMRVNSMQFEVNSRSTWGQLSIRRNLRSIRGQCRSIWCISMSTWGQGWPKKKGHAVKPGGLTFCLMSWFPPFLISRIYRSQDCTKSS